MQERGGEGGAFPVLPIPRSYSHASQRYVVRCMRRKARNGARRTRRKWNLVVRCSRRKKEIFCGALNKSLAWPLHRFLRPDVGKDVGKKWL